MSAVYGTALTTRVVALDRFLRVVSPHVAGRWTTIDAEAVPTARHLVDRAQARLRLGATEHTVVAVAGATGSGKSSLFNALARMELSAPGVLRPTTDQAHACVWGDGDTDALLDWLGIEPSRRFRRESVLDAEDEAALRGVVLLDLPDVDSVATGHRIEANRLVGVVDMVIWVLDPQKYADASVHDGYLRHMGALRDVTVVVFNQIDRLTPSDVDRCLADLRRLVDADGLPGVAVLGASATTGEGVGRIRALLERAVAQRSVAAARLTAELDDAIATLAPLVTDAPAASGVPAGPDLDRELTEEFVAAAGADAVTAEAGQEYRRRAAVPGWPFRRRTLPGRAGRGSRAEVPPADPGAVGLAVRKMAAASSGGLPAPWPDEVRAAATADTDRLSDELGRAVRGARARPPRADGWRLVRVLWWLALADVLVGAGWLVWSTVDFRVPGVGPAPGAPTVAGNVSLPVALVAVGAVVVIVLPLLGWWLAAARARRLRRATRRRMTSAAAAVADEAVAPVRAVLRDYAEARQAFHDALSA
jgi:hypothetical protein